jgi:AraC-like DNA-binding protein
MMPDYPLTLKFIAIAFLLFVTAKFLIDGRFAARSVAFALFTLSVAGYLGCQICHLLHSAPWVTYLIHVGCFMVPWAFYLMNDALFEDRFRFRWMYLAMFIFIEVVHFYLITYLRLYDLSIPGRDAAYISFLRAIPKTIALVYIFAALFKTFSRRRYDLVEERNKFRLRFISINSTYMVIVLISELALQGQQAPQLIEILHTTGVLVTVLYFAARIFSVSENVLGGFPDRKVRSREGEETVPVDQVLLKKLQEAMVTDRAYAQESLTIRDLAKQLDVHEYLLRRLINAGLGYRNFNDYLNELRIKEAARLLSDKEQSSLPIIRIAMDLGFGSLAPFNRAFKERQGMTPTEFRKISS